MPLSEKRKAVRLFLPLSFLLPISIVSAYANNHNSGLDAVNLLKAGQKININNPDIKNPDKHKQANLDVTAVSQKSFNQNLNLDLSNTAANITLGQKLFHGNDKLGVTINRGGESIKLQIGDKVTAGEFAAFQQAKNGAQTLLLDSKGAASGGSVTLNSLESGKQLSFAGLVIPVGVDAFYNVDKKETLTVFGSINNYGNLYSVANSKSSTDARIFAGSINNAAGAGMSTIVNADAFQKAGYNNAINNLGFSLFGSSSINNAGSISSAGNLTVATNWLTNTGSMSGNANTSIAAINGITNAATGSISGRTGVNINAPNFQNNGSLASLLGSIGIGGGAAGNLNLSGIGSINAANNINFNSPADLTLQGNNLTASHITFVARNGTVDVDAGSIDGKVTVKALGSSVIVNRGKLDVESVDVSGDPIFVSNTDSVILPASIVTGGAPVTAIAAKDILGAAGSGTVIDTTAATGGGEVLLLAGAISSTINGITTVVGASGFGGSISGITSINTSGDIKAKDTHGGNITLGAYGGSINVGSLTANASTTGLGIIAPTKNAGRILVFSPGDIHVGNVQSAGTHTDRTTNYIYIANADPTINGTLSFDSQGNKTTSGSVSAGAAGNGSVVTGILDSGLQNVSGLDAGSINVQSGGSITTNSVIALGGGGGENSHFVMYGYDASAPGGNGGNVVLSAANGNIVINGDLNTSGGGGGGANHTKGGDGGAGGNVTITASGDITINGPLLTPGGGGGGGSGISSEDTAGGGASFGNGALPNSGALYKNLIPYNGPATLDRGVVPNNPNHPRYPYPGMGGTNTAYDIGCCGAGYGGDVGDFGKNGGTGTFQRGWWDDTSPHPGGAPGIAGNITIVGRDIAITKTIGTYYNTTNNANLSPYANYSLFAHSQAGGGIVNITSTGSKAGSGVLDSNGDFSSSSASVIASLRPSQVTIVGTSRANSTTINGSVKTDIFAAGTFAGNQSSPISITENGSQKTISNGQSVTPAEWAALLQVANGAAQSLTLGSSGSATGGNYTFTASNTPLNGFSQLVIPTATTFYSQLSNLVVANQAVVNGLLSFGQTSTLSASSITVGSNAKIESTGSNSNLTLSSSNFNLGSNAIISAAGNLALGSAAAAGTTITGPAGGTASLRSGTDNVSITATNGAVNFSSSGAGTATVATDKLQVTGSSVNVASQVSLESDDAISITINGGAFNNSGTIKSILANGNGGSIAVHGNGDLTINEGNLVISSSAPTGGDGGTLDFSSTGVLTLNGSGFDASASGSGDHNGGSIYLMAVDIINASGLAFSLKADGTGNGNGGLVSITKTGVATDIKVNGANDGFKVSARSGSTTGNGGEMRLSAGRDITVSLLNANLSGGSSNGNGARYTLVAGTGGSGDATIDGAVDVSGKGQGAGGQFSLTTNSSSALNVGNSSGYGVHGQITANGGGTSGDAGQISLKNLGAGGINITSGTTLSAAATSGKGGSVLLSGEAGTISVPSGTINTSGGGASGDGGTIDLRAQNISVTGVSALNLLANGSGTGKGGTINLKETSSTSDIVVDSNAGDFVLSATGGSAGSASGAGGNISLYAGRNISIASGKMKANPLGNFGDGANIVLSAGSGGVGVVKVDDSINASAASQGGNGGSALITYNNSQVFTVGSTSPSGVSGSILAGGQNGGTGGTVQFVNLDASGLNIANSSAISAGSNGSIGLQHSVGSVAVTGSGGLTGHLTAVGNSVDIQSGAGDLMVDLAQAKNGALNLQANGGALTVNQSATATGQNNISARDLIQLNGPVSGTEVSIDSSANGVTIGGNISGSTSLSISAHGAGALTRNAGTMTAPSIQLSTETGDITSAAVLTPIAATSLSLSSTGGNIGSALQPLVTTVSSLSANTANGGIVNIVNQGTTPLNLLASTSGGDFSLTTGGSLTVNGIVTEAGSIKVQNNLGKLLIAANAQVIANDGNITLIDNDSNKKTSGIKIDAGAIVKASSTLSQFGNLYIGYGAPQASPALGKLPKKGVNITINNGGQIYLDKEKFKLPNKKLTPPFWVADGKNIIFNAGPKKLQIELGSGAQLIADPPQVTIFAPKENMQVNTGFGPVTLSAGSLVLMASNESSVSIYDLDDTHKDSVSIATSAGKFTLSPGRHITINNASATAFHDVNPIESIGHRAIEQRNIGSEHIAHISEFHMPSAIDSIPVLAQMVRGEHPHMKKQAEHLLKTAAVLLQLGGVADYKLYERPSFAAYSSGSSAALLPLNAD